jgi:3-hydroxyacyl-[acyl-carrier-protein] dehydratase
MTIEEIKEYLPHRYPFLLIDRVISFEKDKRIVALKNVTANEPFFPGALPALAVMPGVLIVEAMAQAAAVLSLKSLGHKNDGKWCTTSSASMARASSGPSLPATR